MAFRNAQPQLQGALRRAMDMDAILNDVVDVNVLAKRHGVTPTYAYQALRALGDMGTVLERYSSLEEELRSRIAGGETIQERDLAEKYGFLEPRFVSREASHIRSEIAAPPKAPKSVTKPTASVETDDAFEAINGEFYDGTWSSVVFAKSVHGNKMPAKDYLEDLYRAGGPSKQRALEFRASIQRYADGDGAGRDIVKTIGGRGQGIMEFKTWGHRIFCRLVQVHDRTGATRRVLVLLSGFEKKKDATDMREIERANALYANWLDDMRTSGVKVKGNPDEASARFWGRVDREEAVRMATIRLMQELQAVIREAMRREGMGIPALADALGISDEDAEAILWDTSVPLEEVVSVALFVGVELGAREIV